MLPNTGFIFGTKLLVWWGISSTHNTFPWAALKLMGSDAGKTLYSASLHQTGNTLLLHVIAAHALEKKSDVTMHADIC